MSSPALLFSPQRVVQVIREIRDELRGKPAAELTASSGAFATDPFSVLREDINKAKAVFDKNPRDAVSHAKLQFAIALYRDFSYTHASRVQLNRLGVQHQIRNNFELARCAVDNNIA